MSLIILSLCTGYGGLDLAVESALDARTVAVSDLDKGANKILAHRFPHAPNLGDLKLIDWAAWRGRAHIITAGYPCQPFSHAGKREGTDDPRHIWPDIARGVAIVRPRLCFFENVRGHLSLGFDEVVRDLHLIGYDVHWVVMRAADIGAPHGRARLFILAEDRDAPGLLGGAGRRGGIYRDSGERRVVSGSAQGLDERQGAAGASDAAGHARGSARGAHARAQRPQPGHLHLADDWGGSCSCSGPASTDAVGEGLRSGCGAGVSGDGRLGAEASERPYAVVGRDAGQGSDVPQQDSGGEPQRTGPDSAATPRCDSCGRVSPWVVVGAGVGPIWSGGVQRHPANVGTDGGGPHLLNGGEGAAADVATPADANGFGHERTRGSRDGREGSTDLGAPSTDASRERHGRPAMGAGAGSLGRLDSEAQGVGGERQRTREVAGDRGAEAAAGADLYGLSRVSELRGIPRAERQGGGDGNDADGLGVAARGLQRSEAAPDAERPRPSHVEPRAHGLQLANADRHGRSEVDWGQYAPAIHRWAAVLGRPAPAPTEPGAKGQSRLSPAFVEFMMGLPAGWVTDVPDLTRNEQLKALGNGVVWQQAEAALRQLLAHIEEAAA